MRFRVNNGAIKRSIEKMLSTGSLVDPEVIGDYIFNKFYKRNGMDYAREFDRHMDTWIFAYIEEASARYFAPGSRCIRKAPGIL